MFHVESPTLTNMYYYPAAEDSEPSNRKRHLQACSTGLLKQKISTATSYTMKTRMHAHTCTHHKHTHVNVLELNTIAQCIDVLYEPECEATKQPVIDNVFVNYRRHTLVP
jgi:hypothetical protein